MRNQLLMWALFVVPWFSLFFMRKDHIKRLMPVAILSSLMVIIINEFGMAFNWWKFKVAAYPMRNFPPYYVGLFPVMTMWIFRFTFQKFWLFLVVEILVNLGFGYLFVSWFLYVTGILYINGLTAIRVFGLATGLGIALYGYQRWQHGIFVCHSHEGNPE